LTEANFGNDDDTMGRLEDMGVAASGLVGDDVSRQNQVCRVGFKSYVDILSSSPMISMLLI